MYYVYIYYVLCIYILYILFYVYMGAFNGATEHVSCIVVKQRANHSSAGTASVKYIVASGFSTALENGSQMFPDSTSLELQIFSNTSSLTHLPSSTMTNKERQETKSAGIPLCFRDRHCSMSEMAPVAQVLMLHWLGVDRPETAKKTLGISCTSWCPCRSRKFSC